MKKHFVLGTLACALLACAALVFAACSSNDSNAARDDGSHPVIRIEYPSSRSLEDQDVSALRSWFEQEYPDAELDLVSSSLSTVNETVKSEIEQGSGPDIFLMTDYDAFVSKGYLADITSFPALTLFRNASVHELERDGKVYALPVGGGKAFALCYNEELFKKYGLEEPSEKETVFQLIERVSNAIDKKHLKQRPVCSSMLYSSQSVVSVGSLLSEFTQKTDFMKWQKDYEAGKATFEDKAFQNYLAQVETLILEQENDDETIVPYSGKVFQGDDLIDSYSDAAKSFLDGEAFMFAGGIDRVTSAFSPDLKYGKEDVAVMGFPVGQEGVSYVSYLDDMYLGVSNNYDSYSDRKKEIVQSVLDRIASDEETRSIFVPTNEYSSVYLDGQPVKTSADFFYGRLNKCIDENFVTQGINNASYDSIFGQTLIAWAQEKLASATSEGADDIERVTLILETYRKDGVDLFEKSAEPIGSSKMEMPFDSDYLRTHETVLGNQVADMARDYMHADFALVNAGGIRASIPEGEISAKTLYSVLPYQNFLVNVKVSGKTLRKAIDNAYDVSPTHPSGQFGELSGLKVHAQTDPNGYKEFDLEYEAWSNAHPGADKNAIEKEQADIVNRMCGKNEKALNLQVTSLTDAQGQELDDNKTYLVALPDYLLKDQDGYSVLGILSDCDKADRSIELYDRDGNRIKGTPDEMTEEVEKKCDTVAECFVKWVKEGNVLQDDLDKRIVIDNLIFLRQQEEK